MTEYIDALCQDRPRSTQHEFDYALDTTDFVKEVDAWIRAKCPAPTCKKEVLMYLLLLGKRLVLVTKE